jgi:hypothetical protein
MSRPDFDIRRASAMEQERDNLFMAREVSIDGEAQMAANAAKQTG